MAKKLITLEDDLFQKLRRYAFERGIPMQKVIVESIEAYFNTPLNDGANKENAESTLADEDDNTF